MASDTQHTDATADAPPVSASPAPAEGLPPFPSAGAPYGFGQCSDRIDAISAALAKAQGALKNPTKDRTAEIKSDKGRYTYTYTTLADGLNTIRAALSANGIAIVQTTMLANDDTLILRTALCHCSGQWIISAWPVLKLPAPPQVIGSALTYARRYCLFALVGIAGDDDDDDGAAASAKGVNASLIDADQLVAMQDLLTETKTSNLEAFFLATGATGFSDMTVPQWNTGMAKLREKRRRAYEKSLQQ